MKSHEASNSMAHEPILVELATSDIWFMMGTSIEYSWRSLWTNDFSLGGSTLHRDAKASWLFPSFWGWRSSYQLLSSGKYENQPIFSAADCCWLLPKRAIASGVPHFKTQFFGQSHKRSSHWQICFPIPIISWVSLLQSLCIVSEVPVLGKLPDCHRSNPLFFVGFFETWPWRIHHL